VQHVYSDQSCFPILSEPEFFPGPSSSAGCRIFTLINIIHIIVTANLKHWDSWLPKYAWGNVAGQGRSLLKALVPVLLETLRTFLF
jgi:hypothetical protein